MRKTANAILLLVLAAACRGEQRASLPPPPPSAGPPMNLLLVSVDTLRADRLGVYGYDRPTSPTVDAFAAEAVVFEQAQAPRALTWPSLTTMLTGMEIHAHGVRRNGERPRTALTSLASVLSDRGYRTGAFLANACEADIPGFGERSCFVSGKTKHFRWDMEATRAALGFLERGGEPFFMWVHLMDPHWPFNCSVPTKPIFDAGYEGGFEVTRDNLLAVTSGEATLSPEDRQHVMNLYDCQVRHVDDRFGELLLALDRMGLSRRTMVVFTSDHGEELGDHQSYYYHTASVYQGCLQVPLLIRHPAGTGAGRRADAVVGLVDLAPTLLELMGVDASLLGPDIAGRSFAPLVTGEGSFEPALLRGEIEDDVVVLRDGSTKYVWNPERTAFPLEPERGMDGPTLEVVSEALFDLSADPGETVNLLADSPDLQRRMRALAEELTADPAWKHEPQTLHPELRERLRALGYASN